MEYKKVYGHGINDLRISSSVKNHSFEDAAIYTVWKDMLAQCYSGRWKSQKNNKNTYFSLDMIVCERWLTLSNFYDDLKMMKDYDKWIAHYENPKPGPNPLKFHILNNERIWSPANCGISPYKRRK